jgi:ABC-type amino acid transport substrate-binding protein
MLDCCYRLTRVSATRGYQVEISKYLYPPCSIVGANGLAEGFSVELVRTTLSALNRQVSFHTGPWLEVRGLLERVEIEALPPVGRSPEREEILDFTLPVYVSACKWFAALQLPVDRAIIVEGDHNDPPFEYLDDNGAIAEETNMAVQFRLGPWADILEGLRSGEVDTIQGMFYSSERDRDFEFAPFHLVSPFVSVTRREGGNPLESFADLQEKSIVVQQGDVVLDVSPAYGSKRG